MVSIQLFKFLSMLIHHHLTKGDRDGAKKKYIYIFVKKM